MALLFIGKAKPLESFSLAPTLSGFAVLYFSLCVAFLFLVLLNLLDRLPNIPQAIQLCKRSLNMQMKGFFLLAFLHGESAQVVHHIRCLILSDLDPVIFAKRCSGLI